MAEVIAVIGLASALMSFVDFGSKVIRQLRQLEDDISESPQVLRNVRTRLPLMLDLVQKILLQLGAGGVEKSTQEHMLPIVQSCVKQAEHLETLIQKTLPGTHDSAWKRGRKAVVGVLGEGEIQRIDAALKLNFDLLVQADTLQSLTRLDRAGSAQSTSSFMMSPTVNVNLIQDDRRRLSSYDGLSLHEELRKSFSELQRIESHAAQSLFMVPFQRDSNFLGRQSILDEISKRFQTQKCVSMAGLGGIGKSQIAIEYSYIFKERNPQAHIFWVYAGNPTTFEQGYADIARKLCLPGLDDPKANKLDLVHSWLCDEQNGEWLLILDNADDASMFFTQKRYSRDADFITGLATSTAKSYFRYMPHHPSGHVLITTRDKRVGERLSAREKPIEVPSMSASESIELLRSRIMEEDWSEADGARLVSVLSYLPLAITQASAYISENCVTVSEYLDMLGRDTDVMELLSLHLEDSRREIDTDNSVMKTWKLSFDHLFKTVPRAAEILSVLAVLDLHGAPRALLKGNEETETSFRTALGALQAFSLITVGRGKDGGCKMHRLVALSTQKWLQLQGSLSHWHSEALRILEEKFPGTGWQTVDDWASLEVLLPHTQLIFQLSFTNTTDLLRCARLLDACALYDLSKGKYEEAVKKSRRSLDIRGSHLPPDDPATLESVQTLGESLLHCGDLKAAKDNLTRAIKGREQVLGPLDPDTLESLSDLTITLLELDDLDAAEKTCKRALSGREEVLGRQDRDTLVSINIHAILLQRRGSLDEARSMSEAALNGREQLLGHGHPDTLMTLNNLARLCYKQGELALAKDMLERVLTGEAKVLSADGYDAQVSMTNMALVLQAQRDFVDAETFLRKVLTIRTKMLGPDHPSTIFTMSNLVDLLSEKGDEASAASMRQRLTTLQDGHGGVEASALLRAGLLFD